MRDDVRRDVVVAENVGAGFDVPVGEVQEQRAIPAGLLARFRDQEAVPGAPQERLQALIDRHPVRPGHDRRWSARRASPGEIAWWSAERRPSASWRQLMAPRRRLFFGLVGGAAAGVAVNRTGRGPVGSWLARSRGRRGRGTLQLALGFLAFGLPGDDRRPLFITRRHGGGDYHGPAPSADAHVSGKVGRRRGKRRPGAKLATIRARALRQSAPA